MTPQNNPWAGWERNFVAQMLSLREAAGMTQTDLAKKLKMLGLPFHQQTIQRIEAGQRPVRLDEAFLIAKLFDVSLDAMTAAPVASRTRELLYAVERVRARAAEFRDKFGEVFEPLLGAIASLEQEVHSRAEHKVDEVTKLGLAELFETTDLLAHSLNAYASAGSVCGLPEHQLDYYLHEEPYNSILELQEFFLDDIVREYRDLDPDELYARLKEVANGEQ